MAIVVSPSHPRGIRSRSLASSVTVLLIVMACFVTFPMEIPGGPSGLRSTELLGVAANGALLLALLSGAVLHRAAIPIAVAGLLTIPWVFAEITSISNMMPSTPARFVLIRWVMALATGYWLSALMDDERYRSAVGLGLMLGLLLSLATVVHDALTFDPSTLIEVTASDDEDRIRWVGDAYRAAGIFGGPNNAAAATLLFVPLVIGFIEERRLPRVALLFAVAVILTTFISTKTRGAPAISALLLGWHLMRGPPGRKIAIILPVAIAVALYAVLGTRPFGGDEASLLERFSDQSAAAQNLDFRLYTMLVALEVIVENPLGLGSSYIHWIDTTHNAYLQLALMAGLPLTFFVMVRLLVSAFGPAAPSRVTESWVAIYLAGEFLFENLFFLPSSTLCVAWLLRRPLRNAG